MEKPLNQQKVSDTIMITNQSGMPPSKPYREFIINSDLVNDIKKFESNYVRTTKYTLWSFVPKSLLIQFLRLANIYFLVIAVLQSISIISPLNPITAIFPLVFVLVVSMIREGIEDYRRYLDDQRANSQPVRVLRNVGNIVDRRPEVDARKAAIKKDFPDFDLNFPDCYEIVSSQNLKVGQVVLMYEDEIFPADLILLGTNDRDNKAYIETAMLDGEKSLKKRVAEKEINPLSSKDRFIFHAKVVCAKPTHELEMFGASILGRNIKTAVTEKHLLPKGAKLKNTKWVTAVVAFAGNLTKLMLNNNKSRVKQSRVENVMNKLIIIILFVQTVLCLVLAILAAIWQSKFSDDHVYLELTQNAGTTFVINFFSYFLLLSTLIPISLIVTLEIVKFMQLFFIQWDVFMYHNDHYAKVSTCTINEELGQIRYIFSDKTGTLTCNKMELKGIRVYDRCYGAKMLETQYRGSIVRTSTKVGNDLAFCFHDSELDSILADTSGSKSSTTYVLKTKPGKAYEISTDKERAYEYLKLLACCHEVGGIKPKGSNYFVYAGQSPDEVCLVDAAQRIAVTFVDNRNNVLSLAVSTPSKKEERCDTKEIKVELLDIFPFDSSRARMSVIIRDEKGLIKLYCKGSDERVAGLLTENAEEQKSDPILSETTQYLAAAASKGYRTLYMAMKVIDNAEYAEWKSRMQNVTLFVPSNEVETKQKNARKEQLVAEIEKGLTYLGCSVVEDKLQDNVENTIHNLGKAGVQVWMITGDKMGTARSIGYSCKMFAKDDMDIVQIDEEYYVAGTQNIDKEKVLSKLGGMGSGTSGRKIGLLITGTLVEKLVGNETTRDTFIHFAKQCNAVVCCRTTANQKAVVVKTMKEACPGEITLSIGDGGNDVPMINEAHVGVGIYGKEGMQAAQAADYAIGEFQCLWNLLMIHGRLAYLRISELILYFFYKNAVFTLQQFYFAFWCAYSGQSYFDSWYISFYNLFFTSIPLLFKALFEHDVHHVQDSKMPLNKMYPYMYYRGQGNQIFNVKGIVLWFFYGALHSSICFFVPYAIMSNCLMSSDGDPPSIWFFSVTSYTCVIVIVNLKLFATGRFFTWINLLGFTLLSLFIYIAAQWISNYYSLFVVRGAIIVLYSSPVYYLTVTVCALLSYTIDHFIEVCNFHLMGDSSNFCRLWQHYYDPTDFEGNRNKYLMLQSLDTVARGKKIATQS